MIDNEERHIIDLTGNAGSLIEDYDVIEWNGNEIKIMRRLSMDEFLQMVSVVSSSVVTEEQGYQPELKDFYTRVATLLFYTDIELPESLEDQFHLVFATDIISCITPYIDQAQYMMIIDSIDRKVDYLKTINIRKFESSINEVVSGLTNVAETIGNMFDGVSADDINKMVGAITDMKFDENKLMQAYLESKKEQ